MAWSKDRIESLSLQVAAANDSNVAWQTIAERNREDLLDLVKERETLAQQHESLTTSHVKLTSDIRRRTVGVGAPVAEGIDFGTLFPTQQAQLEQLDHQLNGANVTWIC
jgi:hypothetical protein